MVNRLFHKMSYLKYLFFIWGGFIYYPEIILKSDNFISNVGNGLFMFGLGMCFESLRDETKITKLEEKIFLKENFYKILLVFLFVGALSMIVFGLYILHVKEVTELGFGILSFSIGNISLVKQGYTRFNYFRENNATYQANPTTRRADKPTPST